MHGESNSEDRKRLKEAFQESWAAAKALTKDAGARPAQAPPPPGLVTIPEAARHLQVAERTLRFALAEPDLHARLVERTRKVGIYYKFIPLLPPDLVADLFSHFAEKGPSETRSRGGAG